MRYFVDEREGQATALFIFTDNNVETKPTFREINLTEYERLRGEIGDLTELKKLCKNEIDAFAGEVRLRFITSTPGQAETYILKATEAKALKSLGYPSLSQSEMNSTWPLIAAEMQVMNQTMTVVCETIIALENGWKQIAAAVETLRLGGKNAVDAATSPTEALNMKALFISQLNNIT